MAELGSTRMLREWIQSEYQDREDKRRAQEVRRRGTGRGGVTYKLKGKKVSRKEFVEHRREPEKKIKRETIRKEFRKGALKRTEVSGYREANEKKLDNIIDIVEKRRVAEVKFGEDILKRKQAEEYKERGKMNDRRWRSAEKQAEALEKSDDIKPSEIFNTTQKIYEGTLGPKPEQPRPISEEDVAYFGPNSPEVNQYRREQNEYRRDIQNWEDVVSGKQRANITDKYPDKWNLTPEAGIMATTPEGVQARDEEFMRSQGLGRQERGQALPQGVTEADIQENMVYYNKTREEVIQALKNKGY